MMKYDLPRAPRRSPLETERARGHRYYGGQLGTEQRERHYIIAAVAGVVAAAVSAYAAYSAAEAQSDAANYNKKVARNQAQAARDAAAIARSNRENEFRHLLASQRARIGASGVAVEGSPLLVESESARQAQLELARTTYAGEIRQTGYQAESILQGFYQKRYQQAQGVAIAGGVASASSSLLGAYNNYNAAQSGRTSYSTSQGYQSYRSGERSYG